MIDIYKSHLVYPLSTRIGQLHSLKSIVSSDAKIAIQTTHQSIRCCDVIDDVITKFFGKIFFEMISRRMRLVRGKYDKDNSSNRQKKIVTTHYFTKIGLSESGIFSSL